MALATPLEGGRLHHPNGSPGCDRPPLLHESPPWPPHHAPQPTPPFAPSASWPWPPAPLAQAGSSLALDKGCYGCHGNAFHPNAPSFEQLADHSAKRRGEAGAEDHLMNEAAQAPALGRIGPHEQLSEESARTLARWILDGAR